MTELNLRDTEWDCCIIGNGVVALWLAHASWAARKSVLWITSEEPYGPGRALLQHGWLWSVTPEQNAALKARVAGDGTRDAAEGQPFELAYFDARSSKRFRRFGEARAEWGAHEAAFFQALVGEAKDGDLNLWDWQARLQAFHDSGETRGFTQVELAREPRFVRVQGWPLLELKTGGGRIQGATLAGMNKHGGSIEVTAKSFFLGDFDENLAGLIRNEADAEKLSGALKSKLYRAGLGLHLRHAAGLAAPAQTVVIPLLVNPEKDAGAHVVGRFAQTAGGCLESFWITLLTDEELEDNNEILKKIKHAKRAIERAVPGFTESIARESVTFEPRMRAIDFAGLRKGQARGRYAECLGAALFSDHYGPRAAIDTVEAILAKAPMTSVAPPASEHTAVRSTTL